MAGVDVSVEAVIPRLESLTDDQRRVVRASVGDAVQGLRSYVLSRWPVDTSLSIRGWRIEQVGLNEFAIVNPVDYVTYVHDGLAERLIATGLDDVDRDLRDDLGPIYSHLAIGGVGAPGLASTLVSGLGRVLATAAQTAAATTRPTARTQPSRLTLQATPRGGTADRSDAIPGLPET